jgi:16S rRNA (adenine1518-N6/adenine1519-N6)-dimethyltransferase
VLLRLTAERTGFHPVSRTVFQPQPNVDSALVAFRRTRTWGPEYTPLKRAVQAAFAHRRKTLANSLALAGFERKRADAAVAAAGIEPATRAEALPPETFLALAEALA